MPSRSAPARSSSGRASRMPNSPSVGTMLASPNQRQTAHEMPVQTARRSAIVARIRVIAFDG